MTRTLSRVVFRTMIRTQPLPPVYDAYERAMQAAGYATMPRRASDPNAFCGSEFSVTDGFEITLVGRAICVSRNGASAYGSWRHVQEYVA